MTDTLPRAAASPWPKRAALSARVTIDFDRINRTALAAFPVVAARLLPGGKRVGHEWIARNPRRIDNHAGSFKINLKTGKWCDFATGDSGGDPVSLAAYLTQTRQGDAALYLAGLVGLSRDEVRHVR